MRHLHAVKNEKTMFVGKGVRVLMLSDGSDPAAQERLIALGGQIENETEMYSALTEMIDDPRGYDVFVMEVDAFGGLGAGMRAFKLLRASDVRIPVILVGRDCTAQNFPDEGSEPTMLRAPLSMVSLRVGFEHALRDRYFLRATPELRLA